MKAAYRLRGSERNLHLGGLGGGGLGELGGDGGGELHAKIEHSQALNCKLLRRRVMLRTMHMWATCCGQIAVASPLVVLRTRLKFLRGEKTWVGLEVAGWVNQEEMVAAGCM